MVEQTEQKNRPRSVMEQQDFERLPKPLIDSVRQRLDAIVQHRHLMLDDQSRYRLERVDMTVGQAGLSDERVAELVGRFSPRLKRVPFTIEGVPSEEEVALTKDIWKALDNGEKNAIVEATQRCVIAERTSNGKGVDDIPDERSHAIRLMHRFLQIKSREL